MKGEFSMNRRFLSVLILFGLGTCAAIAFAASRAGRQWASYEEMRAHIGRLYQEKRYAEAADVLERALDLFPDNLRANTYNLALMYVQIGAVDKGLEALRKGLSRGVWYGKYDFFADVWKPLKEDGGFRAIERRIEALRLEAQKNVEPKLVVTVPEHAAPGRKLPLFIALHGGGENVDVFKPQWTSPLLQKEFIVAYPQSTRLVAPDGYNWTEDVELSLNEIRAVYDKVLAEYPVDPGEVIVGGFSSGGVASLEIVLNDSFPVRGFIVLCPAKPDDFTPEKVTAARKRGVRGTLLTTEMDGRLEAQKEMAAVMEKAGLLQEFVVTPNVGHWYPDDLAERIDAAIAGIRK
jgi:predicted esterase